MSSLATWTSGDGTAKFASSVLLYAGATLTESGATIDLGDAGANARQILMFHNIYNGVVIGAVKYAHVAYTMQY